MGHETYFTEDFQSDDEDRISRVDHRISFPISFMPGPYDDVQTELNSGKDHEEVSTQCENPAKTSLSNYSLMPVISCNPNEKIIYPNPLPYNLSHTARIFFPEVKIEKFKCKSCGLAFKNSQALGGHLSRKH
jgi:hypothetical protein